ncbi:MAG: VapE domain-containing protein [Gloeotrichia echinulata IR180]
MSHMITQTHQAATTVQLLAVKRDIPEAWIASNCVRKSDGWDITGCGHGTQFYPDTPPLNDKGRPVKYLTPKGSTPDLFIPCPPDGVDNPVQKALTSGDRVTFTEGHFKAIKGCSESLPVVSVSGIWNALTKNAFGKRVPVMSLRELIDEGLKKYCIAFDADAATNKDVRAATVELAKVLTALGCDVVIATGNWTVEEGKGIDDFISKNGVEAMRARLEKAVTLEVYTANKDVPTEGKKSRKQRIETVRKYFDGKLKYNEMTQQSELNGVYYANELLYMQLADEEVLEASKDEVLDAASYIAKENSYHPFVDYLDRLKAQNESKNGNCLPGQRGQNGCNDQTPWLEALKGHWDRIFGTLSSLEHTYLTKTMVGTIARVRTPGCDMQSILLFCGKQGTRKSTFLKQWAGEWAYSNAYNGTTDKDDLLKLHSAVIHEIAEFDKIYGKVSTATLKDIITSTADKIRPPYGRDTLTKQRQCILTGTSNRYDLLHDPTGSRRYWIVQVSQKIDTTYLVEHRDELWSLAQQLHESGYIHDLNELEDAQREFMNGSYQEVDPVRDFVQDYCFPSDFNGQGLPVVSVLEMFRAYEIGNAGRQPDKQQARAYEDALRALGYQPQGNVGRRVVDGIKVKTWKLVLPDICDSSKTGTSENGLDRSHTGQPYTARLYVPSDRQTAEIPNFAEIDVIENLALTNENKAQKSESLEIDRSAGHAGQPILECSHSKALRPDRSLTVPDRQQELSVTTKVVTTPKNVPVVPVAARAPRPGDVVVVIGKPHIWVADGTRLTVKVVLSNNGVLCEYEGKSMAGRKEIKTTSLGRDDYRFID